MISRSPQSHGGEDRTADEQRDGIDRQVTGDPRQEGAPSRIKVTGRTNGPSTRPGVFWLPQHDSSSQVLHRQRNQAGGEHSTEQHCTAQRDGVGKTSRDAIGNGSPRQPLSRTAANDETLLEQSRRAPADGEFRATRVRFRQKQPNWHMSARKVD